MSIILNSQNLHSIRPKDVRRRIGQTPALSISLDYTHPVGLGSPANLQAPFAGPVGNRS